MSTPTPSTTDPPTIPDPPAPDPPTVPDPPAPEPPTVPDPPAPEPPTVPDPPAPEPPTVPDPPAPEPPTVPDPPAPEPPTVPPPAPIPPPVPDPPAPEPPTVPVEPPLSPPPDSPPPVPSTPPPLTPSPSPPLPSPSPPPPEITPVPSPPAPVPSPPDTAPVTPPPSPSPPPPTPAPVTPPPSPSPPPPSPSSTPTPPAPTPQTPPSPSPPPPSPPSQPPSTVPSSTAPTPPILSPPSSQPTPQGPPLSPPVVSDSPPPPTLNPTTSPPTSVEIPPPPGSSSRTSTGLIVGVAMGGVAVLAIFGLLWLLFARRKKRKDPYGTEGYYLPRDGFYQGSAQSGIQSNPQSAEHHSMSKSPTALAAVPSRSNSSTPQQLSTSASGGLWSNSSGPDNSVPPSSHGLVLGNVSSTFTFEELSVATDGFSNNNLLGQGGFGYVHKGILPNGKIVAIKSLKAESGQGEREFQAEVETISRVHHKHLVTLVGYCVTGQHKLLVYEFLPNKTMEFHLHGKGQPVMDWATRLKIAVGAAKGLAYLHEDCHPTIIHRDIKAANILLDFNFEAQVADFGLAKFTSDANTHVSTRVMGTFGYLAPEYANSGKLTEKSDVFSFGVMLLELITGRRPVDYSPESQMDDSLVDWARPLLSKAVQDGDFDPLVDPRLENRFNYEELGCMITCAASCVRHSAKRRPRMSQVVRALEGNLSLSDLNDGVRPGFSSIHSSSDFESSTDREDTRKFKKLEYLSEDFSRTRSEFSDSGLSSSDMRRRT